MQDLLKTFDVIGIEEKQSLVELVSNGQCQQLIFCQLMSKTRLIEHLAYGKLRTLVWTEILDHSYYDMEFWYRHRGCYCVDKKVMYLHSMGISWS